MNYWRTLPKDKLQQLVLASVVALAVIGGVLQFYVAKQVRDLTASRTAIETLKPQIAEAESNAQRAAQTEPVRDKVRAFVEAQEKRMVSGDPFAWAVREISLVVERHPVRIQTWHQGAKGQHSQKPAWATYTMRIEVVGRYDEIGRLVQDLENQFPDAEIHSVDLGAGQDEAGTHPASIELALLMKAADKSPKPKEEKHS